MPFYLLAIDRAAGTVGLLSAEVFDDREGALDALRDMVASGEASSEDDVTVHVADLDDAQPVLMLAAAAAPTAGTSDGADVPAPHDAQLSDSSALRTGLDAPASEPSVWARISRPTSSDRFAPTRNEPAEPEPEPAGDPAPWWTTPTVGVSDGHGELAAIPADAASEAAEVADEGYSPFKTVDESFAWAVADTAAAGRATFATDAPAPLATAPAPETEAGVEPAPLPEYPAGAATPGPPLATRWPWQRRRERALADAVQPAIATAPGVPQVVAEPEPTVPDNLETEEAVPSASVEPMPSASVEPQEEPTPPAKAYEPGPVSLDEYTCEDCVYVDTCPKKEESAPADCGLFDWRS